LGAGDNLWNIHQDNYTDNDISWMQFIKILKDTVMTIKEIKKYSQLQSEGSATMSERMNMLINHRYLLNEKIKQLEKHCGKLDEKIEYYKKQLKQ
jgi:DNA-binding transcriptional MerR regulator